MCWYRRRASGVPNGLKDAIGTGDALLVYQRGQDISVGPVEGNCDRTVGDIPDSRSSTLVRGIVSSDPRGYYSG